MKGLRKDEGDFTLLNGITPGTICNEKAMAKSNSCFFGNSRAKSSLIESFKIRQADDLNGKFQTVTSKEVMILLEKGN